MEIIKSVNSEYRAEIIALYVEAFSAGQSAQYIDHKALDQYIDLILENGYALVAQQNTQVAGALLVCPLSLDKLLPTFISANFELKKCLYVAEMMVKESARGKGIGRELLNEFFRTADKTLYTNAFIRVWTENASALALYRKMGFKDIGTIEQTKIKADESGTFVMQKIYLHAKLDE